MVGRVTSDRVPPEAPRLAVRELTKRFGQVIACDDISITVRRGTIHAVVGENGAGKTTLMRCIAGLLTPDAGQLHFDGVVHTVDSVEEATTLGVGMVHQEFSVVDELTLAENLVLGVEPTRKGRLDDDAIRTATAALDSRTGWALPWDDPAGQVGVADLGRFELVRQIHRGADLLILDEPTAVLGPTEVDQMLATMRELRDSGQTLVFITHKLAEVMQVADDITVLKAGELAWSGPPASTSAEELAHRMVGTDIDTSTHEEFVLAERTPLLVASGLRVIDDRGAVHLDDVDLAVRSGEIVGVYGVAGSGQRALVEALMGLRHAEGSVRLLDQEIGSSNTAGRRAAGLSYISPDRRSEGLAIDESILANVVAGQHRQDGFSTHGIVSPNSWKDRLTSVIDRYSVKAAGPTASARSLSGGNQQRLVVGRELEAHPRVLIASDPTRGVDILGVSDIHRFLRQLRSDDGGVLLVSHELDEVLALSDRVLVLMDGRIVASLGRAEASRATIAERMTTGSVV